MASHSPQRSRRPQTQQINPGAMLNRETSPSPSLRERPRAVKGQSMPLVPTANLFVQQGSQNQQQSSPTIPNPGARRSPPLGQISRLLPTPPQPNPPNFADDRRMSPPPGSQQAHGLYARPSPRGPTASYPTTKLHHLEEYQMTPELLADIERADQQYQSVQPNQPYPYSAGSRGESPSSGKGPIIDRARGPADGTIPDNGQQRAWQNQQQQQQQQQQRESPKTRDRPAASPNVAPFIPGQGPSHTPERRMSPVQHAPIVVPGEPHPASYLAQFANREAAAAMRRAPPNDTRLNVSLASQTPPLQNMPTRTPDRSLPVQEEDEVTARNNGSAWQDDQPAEKQFHSPSPTPSSDLNPDNSNQRFDNVVSHAIQAGHRDEDQSSHKHENNLAQYAKRDSNDEDGSFTPRSPTTGLPDGDSKFYPNQNIVSMNPALPAPRAKPRNGSTNHVMLGLESALQESSVVDTQPQQQSQSPADQRQHNQSNSSSQYQHYPPREENGYKQEQPRQQNANGSNDVRYRPPQVYPDDFHSYAEDSTSAYIQSYLHSPRPEAPIPPTPHSHTAAPSPSPLLSEYGNGKDLLAYRAMRAAGSPYPFPYGHVRRNRQMPGRFFNSAEHPSLGEQFAKQWQVYAQNNMGHITDSTMSPSSTPFQGELYEHWAALHTQRMMGNFDAASIQSSPSHQPISLPLPPAFSGGAKKSRYQAKRRSYDRKPPPRVESTQPRETSPELSSSGEETSTAGEERPRSAPVGGRASAMPTATTASTIVDSDDNGEWVDEDEDDDYEDFIELEYHPSFVRNISKRRRKWEVGWESLIQSFQALDRQTDATMVLLVSPSHTTKLHALRSRSLRRQPEIANSIAMHQIRSGFSRVASQRRATRPEKSSLAERFKASSGSSGGDGSDGSSGPVEDSLRRALDVALESLGAMGEASEQRELWVLEELQRSREDRERVESLLRQVLGEKQHHLSSQQPRPAS